MVPLTRKERDKLLRQNDILKAAERVFAVKGYYKTTIQDIAKEAQYATGTLYLYFKDKQALYLTLVEKKVQNLISLVKEKVNQTEDVREKIKVLIQEQLGFFEKNQDFFRIYFSERGGLRWTIKDKISKPAVDKFIDYLDYIADIIKEAQEQKIIRDDFDSGRGAYILSAMLNAVIFRWLKKGPCKGENLKDMSDFILDVFFNGVKQKR